MSSIKKCLMLFICMYLCTACNIFAQTLPELPNTSEVVTCFPDTTSYSRLTVGPVDRDYTNLQSAIDAATPGTIIILDAGVTYNGGFHFPDKGDDDRWIVLISSLARKPRVRILNFSLFVRTSKSIPIIKAPSVGMVANGNPMI